MTYLGKTYLVDRFDLSMFELPVETDVTAGMDIRAVKTEVAQRYLSKGFTSAVETAENASLFSEILGIPVEGNRIAVALEVGDKVVVGLREGEGMKWVYISFHIQKWFIP